MSVLIIVCMVLCTGKEQEYGQMQYGNQNCATEIIWLITSIRKRLREVGEEHGTITILLIATSYTLSQVHYVTKLSKYADILEGNNQVTGLQVSL